MDELPGHVQYWYSIFIILIHNYPRRVKMPLQCHCEHHCLLLLEHWNVSHLLSFLSSSNSYHSCIVFYYFLTGVCSREEWPMFIVHWKTALISKPYFCTYVWYCKLIKVKYQSCSISMMVFPVTLYFFLLWIMIIHLFHQWHRWNSNPY